MTQSALRNESVRTTKARCYDAQRERPTMSRISEIMRERRCGYIEAKLLAEQEAQAPTDSVQPAGSAPMRPPSDPTVLPPGRDLEAIFCVALLNTLDMRQTQSVLQRYIALRDDADNVLEALDNTTTP